MKRKIKVLPHQKRMQESDKEFVGLVAGYGAGKTHSLIQVAVDRMMQYSYLGSKNVGLFTEPTGNMIHDILEPKLFLFLSDIGMEYSYNKTYRELKTKYGMVRLRSGENHDRLPGAEYSFVCIDEFDKMQSYKDQKGLIQQIVARTRVKGTYAQKFIATTPEPGRYAEDFFTRGDLSNKQLIQARTSDNPWLPSWYLDNLRSAFDEELLKAYFDGQFVSIRKGMAYYMFDRDKHLINQNYMESLFNKLILSFDFNVSPMTISIIIEMDGRSYVIGEYYQHGSNTRKACNWVKDNILKFRDTSNMEVDIYGDATGKNRSTQSNISNYQIIDEVLKPMVGTLNIKVPRANPAVIDRINAFNNAFDKDLLKIYSGCEHLIKDVEKVQFTEDGRNIDKKSNPNLTHISDALGYYIYARYSTPASFGQKTTVSSGNKYIYNRS